MQLRGLLALVAASSLSARCLSVIAAPAPNAHGEVGNINVLDSQNRLNHGDGSPPVHTTQNGRLEAHWSFLLHGSHEVDYLYVDFYDGNAGSPSTLFVPARPATEKVLQLTHTSPHQPAATPGQSQLFPYKANSTAWALLVPTAPPPALQPMSFLTQIVRETQ